MPETIKIPGIGPVRTPYVWGGVGIAAGIVVYAYWRQSQAPPAEPVEESEQIGTDVPAESEYAYVGDAGYDYGPSLGAYPSYQGPNYSGTIPSQSPTTNQEWAQKAREQLEHEGVDSSQASSAIGTYLAHLCVSSTQADLVRRALAMVGSPPQGTFSIVTCPAPPPSQPPPASGGKPGAPTGLHVIKTSRSYIVVDWTPPPGPVKGYVLYQDGRKRGDHPNYTLASWWGLSPNRSYKLGVAAVGMDGSVGPTATISARTSR